ncbi:hypothetical protein [Legionella pneumophila]|uniref:hypothetical protein n=1 Tax=Legionella pneumophila TaxID=446 RepID=UPI000152763E|nr:hypothetical protein [Legionella pneumophila]HAT8879193.1 hypothetical protein [Legionella pneumophila subsp. pneumophila]ABQ54209.1 hypothetical protein LPC_0211 [Legionella pneumophila str. Corby]ADG23445.1 hypothetical protein lpa_00280 [Legionella pneumophila 2300/99 Alcoy]CZH77416.1 Uncharacterised protein [Legionella pneumophila]CZH84356.1 Uncharacterised protein [Legionella pneumophila]
MIINNLIKKGFLTNNIMLTSATIATDEPVKISTVAEVATVAVGNLNNSCGSLTSNEKQKILSWLEYIGEKDPLIIIEVLEFCRNNVDSRQYFLQRAKEVPEIK